MAKYLSVVRKQEFPDFYKCGNWYLNPQLTIRIDCEISELGFHPEYFVNLTEKMNEIEYSSQFIIICYEGQSEQVAIEQVIAIIPFDGNAFRDLSDSFSTFGVNQILEPVWEQQYNELVSRMVVDSSKKGAYNVVKLFGFSDADYAKCQKIVKDYVIEEWVTAIDKSIEGDHVFWVYLLAYERHSAYPKNIVGNFLDLAHVYVNYFNHSTQDNIEGASIYGQLIQYPANEANFERVFEFVCKTALYKQVTNLKYEFDLVKVCVLFFYLLDKYRESFKVEKEIVDHSRKQGELEFLIASYLLGLKLGYNKTYECYYEAIKLPLMLGAKKEETSKVQVVNPKNDEITDVKVSSKSKKSAKKNKKDNTQPELGFVVEKTVVDKVDVVSTTVDGGATQISDSGSVK